MAHPLCRPLCHQFPTNLLVMYLWPPESQNWNILSHWFNLICKLKRPTQSCGKDKRQTVAWMQVEVQMDAAFCSFLKAPTGPLKNRKRLAPTLSWYCTFGFDILIHRPLLSTCYWWYGTIALHLQTNQGLKHLLLPLSICISFWINLLHDKQRRWLSDVESIFIVSSWPFISRCLHSKGCSQEPRTMWSCRRNAEFKEHVTYSSLQLLRLESKLDVILHMMYAFEPLVQVYYCPGVFLTQWNLCP